MALARERLASHRAIEDAEVQSGKVKSAYQSADLNDAHAGEFVDIQKGLREFRVRRDALAARFEQESDLRMQRLRDSVNDPVPPAVPAELPPYATPAESPRPVERAVDPKWTLNGMAAEGCIEPWSQKQDDLDFEWPRLRGTRYRPEWADAMNLSGCQRVLFLRLLSMASAGTPERLTREAFAIIAAEARAPAPPIEDIPEPTRGTQPPDRPRCRFMGDWCGANTPPKN